MRVVAIWLSQCYTYYSKIQHSPPLYFLFVSVNKIPQPNKDLTRSKISIAFWLRACFIFLKVIASVNTPPPPVISQLCPSSIPNHNKYRALIKAYNGICEGTKFKIWNLWINYEIKFQIPTKLLVWVIPTLFTHLFPVNPQVVEPHLQAEGGRGAQWVCRLRPLCHIPTGPAAVQHATQVWQVHCLIPSPPALVLASVSCPPLYQTTILSKYYVQ